MVSTDEQESSMIKESEIRMTNARDGVKSDVARTVTRKGAGRVSVSDKKDWGTPAKYVNSVKEVFGGEIDLDPCSNEHTIVHAKTEYRLPQADGLKETWNFAKIYVNPPYGNDKENGTTIRAWLGRCAHANTVYKSEVIALVPVAVNTKHWKEHVFTKARAVCFLYDTRLKFLENGRDTGVGAPMACAMVYWGERYEKFYEVFLQHGAVVDLSHLFGVHIGSSKRPSRLLI